MTEFLNALTELSAADFPEPDTKLGFDSPAAKVTCALTPENDKEGEVKKTLLFGIEYSAPAGYAAVVEGTDEPFIVTTDTFRKVTPRAESLLKSEAAPDEGVAASSETSPVSSEH